jgi:hypothetical protein
MRPRSRRSGNRGLRARAVCYPRAVHRAWLVAALGMIGCGRLDFSAGPRADGGADGSAVDAPPVPASICKVDRIPVGSPPAAADLAIAPTAEGYAAFWVDTAPIAAVHVAHGMVLGPNHAMQRSAALPDILDVALGGAADAGQKLMLAGSNGHDETLWVVERDLSKATAQTTLSGRLLARDPYPSDMDQKDRAFVTARNATIEVSLVSSDGTANVGGASQFTADGPISELACADGPSHSHCVWADQPAGGAAECIITDVNYMGSIAPVVGGHFSIVPGCSQIRNTTGPLRADGMMVVWTDINGAVQAHYAVSSGDLTATIGIRGAAPKVGYDGTRFWIAWLDGGGELRLTSFEVATGVLVQYELPGWQPAGPEAFELVTRGNETALVLLSSASLDLLTICS